jgi:hypothetical protein
LRHAPDEIVMLLELLDSVLMSTLGEKSFLPENELANCADSRFLPMILFYQ